jgi:ABC-type transport system involved in multi-copper enzyme maturation permease subunit
MAAMREVVRRIAARSPLQFRVLYRQFLLRVVDLEALSVHADVPRFLGQFAGVLILINVFRTMGFLFFEVGKPGMQGAALTAVIWQREQGLVSMMMLVTGLIAVVSWDAIFPDRRDAMVLGPLPVTPGTILAAKVAACAAVLGIALVSLASGMGLVIPLVVGSARLLIGYWFAMAAACVFVYGAVLAIQGLLALVLSRKMFLRASAALQLAAFAWFVASYFLEPALWNPGWVQVVAPRGELNAWPSFWFFAMEQQIAGTMPEEMHGIAMRAWLGLAGVVVGAVASLALCYLRTMKKTVEEPDLVPGRKSWRWWPQLGGAVEAVVVRFTARGLARSRHHRVIYAFYWAIVFAIAVSTVRTEWAGGWWQPVTPAYMMPTFVMMCLAVVGLRSVFSLPVSLHANWMLQVTQLNPSQRYIAGVRRALLLLSAAPAWGLAAALGLGLRPWGHVAEHLGVLALVGWIVVELCLIGVSKIPFACSYLPGKTNLQYVFWGLVGIFLPIAMSLANEEVRVMGSPLRFGTMVGILAATGAGLWFSNRYRARSAVLYYEETEPEVITTLGLTGMVMENQPPA